jgi:ribose/xylose/arabinose/galactoside ABC-type transport system permease subunit
MKFTPFGRRPRAGDSAQETLGTRLLYRGLPFVFSSLMSWIAGILFLSWVRYATIASGTGLAEMALLATLIGGTAYYAGTSFVLSGAIALISVVLFQYTNQMANIAPGNQKVIQGVLLLVMLPIAHYYHVGVDWLYRHQKKI